MVPRGSMRHQEDKLSNATSSHSPRNAQLEWKPSNYCNVSSWRNTLIKLTHYDETKKRAHDSEIVRAKENLKLRKWFRDFLPGALGALLFGGAEPFVQFERGHHRE